MSLCIFPNSSSYASQPYFSILRGNVLVHLWWRIILGWSNCSCRSSSGSCWGIEGCTIISSLAGRPFRSGPKVTLHKVAMTAAREPIVIGHNHIAPSPTSSSARRQKFSHPTLKRKKSIFGPKNNFLQICFTHIASFHFYFEVTFFNLTV